MPLCSPLDPSNFTLRSLQVYFSAISEITNPFKGVLDGQKCIQVNLLSVSFKIKNQLQIALSVHKFFFFFPMFSADPYENPGKLNYIILNPFNSAKVEPRYTLRFMNSKVAVFPV